MPKDLSSVKLKVIQLRVNKHLSIREIHQQTGVPKGTLSNWLKPYPLPEEIRKAKQAVAYEKLQNYVKTVRKRQRPIESKYHQALGDRELTSYQRVLSFEEVKDKTAHVPQEQDEERWDKLFDS